jgi:phage recombination protein Bet
MTQAIEVSTPTPISSTTSGGWTREQLDLLKETLAKDLTDNEFKLFSFICQKTNLDPFGRQIYAVKRGGRMVIQTGIDGFRIIAGRTGEHGGTSDIEYDSDDGPNPKWAKVTVTRLVAGKERFFSCTARWNEFAVLGHDGKPNTFWRKMPFHMLGKVAESHALRKAFPNELSGLYTSDEMGQADNPVRPQIQKPQPKAKIKTYTAPEIVAMTEEELVRAEEESFSEPEPLVIPEVAPVALESGGEFVDQQDGFVTVTVKAVGPTKEGTNSKGPWTKFGFLLIDEATGSDIGWANTFSKTVGDICRDAHHTEAAVQVKLKESKYGFDILEAVGGDE